MQAIQLEFNIKNETESEQRLTQMQAQIDAMHESMGKVRRKLFSQVGEIQKLCLTLQIENENLKKMLRKTNNEKTEWIYAQNDCLFDVREREEAYA